MADSDRAPTDEIGAKRIARLARCTLVATQRTLSLPQALTYTKGLRTMTKTQYNDSSTARHNLHEAGDSAEKIKNDLNNMKHDITDAARSGASEIRQGMGDAVEAGKDAYQGAKDMVREGYEGTRKAAGDATSSVRNVVSDHPLASIGIAAGAGLLLGSLLMWRVRS